MTKVATVVAKKELTCSICGQRDAGIEVALQLPVKIPFGLDLPLGFSICINCLAKKIDLLVNS